MKNIILHILCEGQTEEKFVRDVLRDYLLPLNIFVKPQLLLTSRKKNSRGGMLHYEQVKKDLSLMFKQFHDTETEEHWFTTMFDLYALPSDFPANDRRYPNPYMYVEYIENAFAKDINKTRLITYIQLHEFESLVFAGLDFIKEEYPASKKLNDAIDNLAKALHENEDNPELVNNNPNTAPSKRIISALNHLHNYNKPKMGASVTKKIGIQRLKDSCPHFSEWIRKIEALAI